MLGFFFIAFVFDLDKDWRYEVRIIYRFFSVKKSHIAACLRVCLSVKDLTATPLQQSWHPVYPSRVVSFFFGRPHLPRSAVAVLYNRAYLSPLRISLLIFAFFHLPSCNLTRPGAIGSYSSALMSCHVMLADRALFLTLCPCFTK